MGRGSPIPPMLQRKIVEQYQKGVSQRKIAKSLKLSSSTVHNIIQRFRESGTISVHKDQGRKTILDARDLRDLRRHCITYRNATVMEITTWAQEYFQKTLSVIHRAIYRCRLKLYRSKKKPYLNMIQKHRHFLWAKAHLKWTVAKWKTVLWSDESKFEVLFGKLGRHVNRTKEDKDNPSCYQRSVQKPTSLMAHCFSPYICYPFVQLFINMVLASTVMRMTQLYVSAKSDEIHQLIKIEECVKDIRQWMLTNFLLLNSDKTEVLVLGPHAARSKFSDYRITVDGVSVSSCPAVKDLGVIIVLSFV
ncbi:hypothetical protein QTP86_019815 [Hemibagrus guttatus]|nr:hypothetical protein QTP86_019815 [Hemibagrus guttatus]